MKYNAKSLSKKVRSKITRHKKNRYHNDAALFPDDSSIPDRKRRSSLKRRENFKKM